MDEKDDLGWSFYGGIASPLAFVVPLFARFGAFGRGAADAQWLELATSAHVVLAVFAFASFLSFWLIFKRGQPGRTSTARAGLASEFGDDWP